MTMHTYLVLEQQKNLSVFNSNRLISTSGGRTNIIRYMWAKDGVQTKRILKKSLGYSLVVEARFHLHYQENNIPDWSHSPIGFFS